MEKQKSENDRVFSESNVREKAKESDRVRRQLSRLENQKKQAIKESKNTKDTERDTTNIKQYITGYVDSVTKKSDRRVSVKVKYTQEGEHRTKKFSMKIPSNIEEYSIRNRYIRLRQTIGLTNEENILGREVPLVVLPDGAVELHIVNKPTTKNKLLRTMTRKLLSSRPGQKIRGISSSESVRGFAVSVFGVIMGVISLLLLFNAYYSVGLRFVADLFISCMSIGLLAFFAVSLEKVYRRSIMLSTTIATFFGLLLLCVSVFSGNTVFWIAEDKTAYQNSISVIYYIVSATLFISSYIYLNHKTEYLNSYLNQRISDIKRKICSLRGIEYVEVES